MADRVQQFIEGSIAAVPYARAKETHDYSDGVNLHNGEKFDDLAAVMGGMPDMGINNFQIFNAKMQLLKNRFMAINLNEKRITREILGIDANYGGDSDAIGPNVPRYSYTAGRNYIDFMSDAKAGEQRGVLSTRRPVYSQNGYNEREYKNLYPDEYNKGLYDEWITDANDESILAKTKRLFDMHKINTIISAFGTNTEFDSNDIAYNGSIRTEYGESKGRNLLTKSAETGAGTYNINGYKNPYCRAWTHHYQYNVYGKTMRTFYQTDGDGNFEPSKLEDVHNHPAFHTEDERWGWKGGRQLGWEQSVLNTPTGMVNITPKYLGGGGMNKHTKDCMFSIENLAWKDYDPYSFEQALSWEQRGPLGGRIMWFPPYGINVTESTSTRWNENEFIGRGEKVYTYTNTERTASLTFMMVVDHPSIIDYATYYDGQSGDGVSFSGNGLNDNDIHRFFAGCDDPGVKGRGSDAGGVFSAAKPTPLTDEGLKDLKPVSVQKNNLEPPVDNPKETDDEPVDEASFYVFFPNNYSGAYDAPIVGSAQVHTIAYLLNGRNTNKVYREPLSDEDDIAILFDGNDGQDLNGIGYEVTESGISDTSSADQYIAGNNVSWQKVPDGTNRQYVQSDKHWWYRIDGEYRYPSNSSEGYKNTYGQTLVKEQDYSDNASFRLNSVVDEEAVKSLEGDGGNIKGFYSLTEVVAALVQAGKADQKWSGIYYDSANRGDAVDNLAGMFKDREVESVECTGFSNSHGSQKGTEEGSVGYMRNKVLAENRALSVSKWIVASLSGGGAEIPSSVNHSIVAQSVPNLDVNDKTSKIYRSAKCTIRFKTTENKTLAETQQSDPNAGGGSNVEKYIGYADTGKTTNDVFKFHIYSELYSSETIQVTGDDGEVEDVELNPGKEWVEVGDGRFVSLEEYYSEASLIVNPEDAYRDNLDDGQQNKVRYDQEYHFFKELKANDPFKFDRLMEKLKYFDPAFHSMTPEGFNARLTFLNQCMRQGDTVSASDVNGNSAKNLAFGRPPYCVLRLGDFYRQLVVIDNINFDYNESSGLLWDLNPEGAGAQPMLCKVTMNLKLIGGGDISGPVRRLQNAMSFNYYANTSLYDNRADRTWYAANADYDIQMGGNGNDQPLSPSGDRYSDNVYAHNVERNLDFRLKHGNI